MSEKKSVFVFARGEREYLRNDAASRRYRTVWNISPLGRATFRRWLLGFLPADVNKQVEEYHQ